MSQHFALALRNREPGWLALSRENGTWRGVGMTQSLLGLIEPTIMQLVRNPVADFSFSGGRTASVTMGHLVEEQPSAESLRSLMPGRSITVLLPIGSEHYGGNMWCTLWRDPRGNLSAPPNARYADTLALSKIREWFEFYDPSMIEKGRKGALELLLRRNWKASEILPEEFPGPRPHPESFHRDKAAYEAKRAAKKRKGRPVKAAEVRP
jgi:hypothetical protein